MEVALRLLVLVEVLGGVRRNLSMSSVRALEARLRILVVSSAELRLRACALPDDERLRDDLIPRICFVRSTMLFLGLVSGEEESVLLCIC